MRRQRKKVALIYDATLSYDVQIMSGVAAYAKQLDEWEIFIEELALHEQRLPAFTGWRGDGVIADFDNHEVARRLLASGLPTVAIGGGYANPPEVVGVPFVLTDNPAISRLAFGHLRGLSFKNFAFFGYTPNAVHGWSHERESSFSALANAAGGSFASFRALPNTAENWQKFANRALRWLRTLPKPVGVLADSDKCARLLLEVCHSAEICVPAEIAVVGVDNDLLLCEISSPSLTSIEQGTFEIGRRAADILHHLMQGIPCDTLRTIVPPKRVVARASTDTLASADTDAARAMYIIREHACHGLTVQKICREVERSRTGLEERFISSFGITLAKAITRARLNRAHELILGSSSPLKEIAERSGFRSIQHMTTLFGEHYMQTPAALRKTRQI